MTTEPSLEDEGAAVAGRQDRRWKLSSRHGDRDAPVVLVGPYEHHSNEVMWRETTAEVCLRI